MNLLYVIVSAAFLVLSVVGQEGEYVRGQDPQADAIFDIQTGMAGLSQATKDPALLAQLMRDMADPEMMEEARKMMESPEFKKQMKGFEKSKEFKDASKKAKEMMKDPSNVARVQAQMEHMIQRGEDTIKKGAKDSMAEALTAMQDPEVMADAAKLLKDPQFAAQMQNMMKDPSFGNYINAMQDMMKDPEKKAQIEAMTAGFRAAL